MTANDRPSSEKPTVMFVPGAVTPGDIAYGPVLSVIGDQIRAIVKELEVYAIDAPPPNYGVDMEVEGIRRAAEAAGVQRFHLVGYSGGGAMALAFTAKYPIGSKAWP